jgi:hypothetical protein
MNGPAMKGPDGDAARRLPQHVRRPETQITWPILLCFARLILAFLAQGLTAALFAVQGAPHPWAAAAPYWTVYGTLIDLGCLLVIARLVRREGQSLADLLHWDRKRFGRDLLAGLVIGLGMMLVGVAGGVGATIALYGSSAAPAAMGGLPLGAALYSVLVWPVLWGLAEQLTYQGYALPRLLSATGQTWPAITLVAFGWALQHVALPLQPDATFMLWRFVTSLPVALASLLLFLRTRRLFPFVVAHWFADGVAALTQVLLPLLLR